MDWININEKQPEKYKEIIVCSSEGRVKAAMYMGDGKFNTFVPVAFWMPFPSAPDNLEVISTEPLKKKRGRKKKV